MQKEIQLTDKTLLVVGLPKEANRFKMFPDIGSQPYLSYFIGVETHREYVGVGYEFLGIYPELTEEMVKMVVEANEIGEYKSYKEHFTNPYFFGYKTALESFQSLMEREKCYTVNPYGDEKPELEPECCGCLKQYSFDEPPQCCGIPVPTNESIDLLKQWQEAQQTIFDKYAILIKSK